MVRDNLKLTKIACGDSASEFCGGC